MIGVTVAAPFYADGKLAGVAAADITLGGLGAYLAERKISPGTLSYILDHQGLVIAASDLSNTSITDHGSMELRHISSLDNPLPAMAFSARPRQGQGVFSFAHRGQEYVASLSNLPAQFGKRGRSSPSRRCRISPARSRPTTTASSSSACSRSPCRS